MKRVFLFFMSALCILFALKGEAADFADIPKLAVRGEASVFKPADQFEVALGVVTTGETSTVALNENNLRIHQVIDHLQALGLPNTDYQTGRFTIHPIYQKTDKDASEDNRAKILSYEVVNAIKVKTTKIDLAEKIIALAVQEGANQIDQLNFSLNQPQTFRDEVIQAAAQNALADANVLAAAMGVKLKRILSLSLEHWQQVPHPVMLNKRFQIASSNDDQAVLEPGQTEIHATVNVIFEIGQ